MATSTLTQLLNYEGQAVEGICYYYYSTRRSAVERVHYSIGRSSCSKSPLFHGEVRLSKVSFIPPGRSGCRKSPLFHGEVRLLKESIIPWGGQAAECAAACSCSVRDLSACPAPHCCTPQEPLLHLHRDHALFTLFVHRHMAF